MTNKQLILNRYRPMSEAGTGGFATVQVAWDTQMQRKVAIKCIELTRTASGYSPDEVANAAPAPAFRPQTPAVAALVPMGRTLAPLRHRRGWCALRISRLGKTSPKRLRATPMQRA